jgi:transketolase
VTREKVQVGVAAAMKEKYAAGIPVVSVSSDLQGSTGTAGFHKEYPEASFDVGVAEANMVSVAAGLSKEGYIPVVDTFSQFGVTKGALPMIMANLSQAPMIAVFSHIGFQDAADGASHQALSYLSMTASIPYTDTFCLASSSEAQALVGQALEEMHESRKQGKTPRSKIFFLGRENFPRTYGVEDNQPYKLGQAQVVFDNSDESKSCVTIVAAGALLLQALEAAELRGQQGLGTIVINPSSINRPDVETVAKALKKSEGRLLTAEDHQLVGGMGAMFSHALLLKGLVFQMKSLGVKDQFGQSAYTALELYRKHGLDAEAMVQACEDW